MALLVVGFIQVAQIVDVSLAGAALARFEAPDLGRAHQQSFSDCSAVTPFVFLSLLSDAASSRRRITGLLSGTGWRDIRVTAVTEPARIGSDVGDAMSYVRGMPKLRDLTANMNDPRVTEHVLATIADEYAARQSADGVWGRRRGLADDSTPRLIQTQIERSLTDRGPVLRAQL